MAMAKDLEGLEMSVVMNTPLPSKSNTKRVLTPSEGEQDVVPGVHVVPDGTHPFPVGRAQESRMRSNISHELGKLGFGK